jgi:amino acid adenylation domain-containing protein
MFVVLFNARASCNVATQDESVCHNEGLSMLQNEVRKFSTYKELSQQASQLKLGGVSDKGCGHELGCDPTTHVSLESSEKSHHASVAMAHHTPAFVVLALVSFISIITICWYWLIIRPSPDRSSQENGSTLVSSPIQARQAHSSTPLTEPTKGPEFPLLQQVLSTGGHLPGLIEKVSSEYPQDTALVDGESGAIMTYEALMSSISAFSMALQRAGLGNGDVVAHVLPPSWSLVIATLAVNKSGCAWVPLDAASPTSRILDLFHGVGARLLLQSSASPPRDILVPVWLIGQVGDIAVSGNSSQSSSLLPEVTRTGRQDVAAIFYTSGSSGRPKAVMYGHTTILHGVLSFAKLCDMDRSSVALIKTPPVWAVSEYELFPALVSGGKVITDARCQKNVTMLEQSLARHGISVLVSSGPVLQMLLQQRSDKAGNVGERKLSSLKHIVNVGAGISMELCESLRKNLGSHLAVCNIYGCTETPVTEWTYKRDAGKTAKDRSISEQQVLAPAGRPGPEVAIHIVDAQLCPVSAGQCGEICFAGPFLSLGYFNDPKLTEQRFIPNPFGTGLLYRTGDMGFWGPDPTDDNNLAVLCVQGRKDRQFNLRGIRVAPEEVEAAVASAPGVQEVSCVVGGGEESGRIVACVVGSGTDLKSTISAHCHEHLPEHMCPAVILQLKSLPKLGNGKVDLIHLEGLASEAVDGEEHAVNDSLGMMKKASARIIREDNVLSASRAVAMMAVFIFHEFYVMCTQLPYDVFATNDESAALVQPRWFITLLRGAMQSQWPMMTFVVATAYADRRDADQSLFSRKEMYVLFLFFAAYWPMPELFTFVWNLVLPYTTMCEPAGDTSHRWYLAFHLACRVLHVSVFTPVSQAVAHSNSAAKRMSYKAAIVLVFTAWAYFQTSSGFNANICSGLPKEHALKQVLAWFLPYIQNMETDHTVCHLWNVEPRVHWLIVAYTVTWWFGADLFSVHWLKGFQRIGPYLALGMLLIVWYTIGELDTLGLLMKDNWGSFDGPRPAAPWVLLTALDLSLSCLVIMTFSLMSEDSSLKKLLVWMGKYTLGAYLGEALWKIFAQRVMPNFSESVIFDSFISPSTVYGSLMLGLSKLVLMFAPTIAYMSLVAPPFQKFCLLSFTCCERMLRVVVARGILVFKSAK